MLYYGYFAHDIYLMCVNFIKSGVTGVWLCNRRGAHAIVV
jgi:hypothetical protein